MVDVYGSRMETINVVRTVLLCNNLIVQYLPISGMFITRKAQNFLLLDPGKWFYLLEYIGFLHLFQWFTKLDLKIEDCFLQFLSKDKHKTLVIEELLIHIPGLLLK